MILLGPRATLQRAPGRRNVAILMGRRNRWVTSLEWWVRFPHVLRTTDVLRAAKKGHIRWRGHPVSMCSLFSPGKPFSTTPVSPARNPRCTLACLSVRALRPAGRRVAQQSGHAFRHACPSATLP